MLKIFYQTISLVMLGAMLPITALAGGDCSTATSLPLEPWSTPTYTCQSAIVETFASPCFLAGQGYPETQPGCTASSTCSQQLWFRFDAGDPTMQYNVRFTVTADFSGTGASQVRYYILYSEARDSGNGDPCTWVNTNTEPFTLRTTGTGCTSVPDGTHTFSLWSEGMDGDGTYFVLFERVTGTGGSLSLCAKSHPFKAPQPAPANDRCNNATTLSVGSGIDSNYMIGGGGAWSDGASGTTQYATKERRTAECSPAGNTEDHFYRQSIFGDCHSNWNIGDDNFVLATPTSSCVDNLENTVFFSVTIPANTPPAADWYLHIGAVDCPTINGSNAIQVMFASSLDCNNADNTNVMVCGNATATGGYPSPDLTFGPIFGVTPGNTYYLIFDGIKGGGCDFSILMSTSIINPVLPVSIEGFTAINEGTANYLNWETTWETDNSHFEVQRGHDGEDFQTIGRVEGSRTSTTQQQYSFIDTEAPLGKTYYRLKPIDIDGKHSLSQVVSVVRDFQGFEWHDIAPVPMQDRVSLRFTASEESQGQITVVDLAGRVVKQQPVDVRRGTQREELDVSSLSGGIYFVQLRVGKFTRTKKVVKQ